MNIILPKSILYFIDYSKSSMSRATYMIKCVDYIRRNNININLYYENLNNENNDDRSEDTLQKGKGGDFNTM